MSQPHYLKKEDPMTYLILLLLLVVPTIFSGCGSSRDHHPDHESAIGEEIGRISAGTRTGEREEILTSWIEDPPKMYGEEIDDFEGGKYILLLAGDEVSERVIVDMGPPVSIPNPMFAYYEVVPPSEAPAGATIQHTYRPTANMAQAWAGLIRRYTSTPFTDAGWVLVPIRATSTDVINAALGEIRDWDPQVLVVHYFGHGDADYSFPGTSSKANTRPWFSLRGHSLIRFDLPDPNGVKRPRLLEVPDPNNVDKYYVDVLVGKLQTDFPAIPLILIHDACESAQALNYKAGLVGMVVSVDHVYCGSNLGLFSAIYSQSAAPADFDQFVAQMPGRLATVNATLTRNEVSYVDTDRGLRGFSKWFASSSKPKQKASLDTWHYP